MDRNAHGAIAQKAGVSFKGMGAIRKGRSAWEKAIELDPKHLGARQTLILFFLAAPGIAGGGNLLPRTAWRSTRSAGWPRSRARDWRRAKWL